ncbi:hypothetical protein [Luteithermobacter gelatinilyticus]|uniref:hypothetical protein n=1 Tax=Luteithermobacter gelatinilyticus TaxID=2582913 RepID=UPI001106E26D|nr:hypothetical protein [Luteithermobacter gelatinilyticus]
MEKDVGFRIRLQRELREKFLAACHAEDKSAAQVIREFMREYVSKRRPSTESPAQQSPENRDRGNL